MEELIKSLPIVLRGAGQSEEVAEAVAIAAFRHVAGAGLREHAVPLNLADRTLFVAVSDQIWQHQIASISSQLIFRVNSILRQSCVSRIEVVVDPAIVAPRKVEPVDDIEPTPEDLSLELWSAANAIHDAELRQHFLKAASTSLRRRPQNLNRPK